MANQINTRIRLKYDLLATWLEKDPVLLAGEVAIATVATNEYKSTETGKATHPVLFKVGNGTAKFSELPWASALAADVYNWAKEAALVVNKDGTGNVVAGIEWDATANNGKGGLKYTTASVATSEGLEAVQAAIEAINATLATYGDIVTHNASEFATAEQGEKADSAVQSVSLVSGTNNGTLKLTIDGVATDNIAVTGLKDAAFATVESLNTTAKGYADAVEAKIPTELGVMSVTEGSTNGTIAVDGTDVAVKGLGSAAYTDSTAYDAFGAAADAESNAKSYTDQKLLDFENAYIKADENGTIDKLNEIAAWIADDKAGATKIIADVATNAANIQTVSTDLDKVELQLNGIAAGDGAVKNAIEAAQTAAQNYADGLASNYATAEQGEKADSAVQPGDLGALATKDSLTAAEVGAATADDITIAIEALDSSIAATAEADNQVSVLTGVIQADGKLTGKTEVTLAKVAKTGSIYDLNEVKTTEDTAITGGDYLIFYCGDAEEVI